MSAVQPEVISEFSLDSVFYAILAFNGQKWRLGAVNPQWQDKLDAENFASLEDDGIWIMPESGNPVHPGVMCCGLGSVWAGMGRELYSDFAVAREAMDRIAALADWDVLALMDEPDITRISQSRWQIPYLFMLEYAQWMQFQAFGLEPGLICGHSLGELIALCVSGIYDLPSVWFLLETRAEHMAELEARGGKEGGMLAVPAEYSEIAGVLGQWPDLRISNRNTHKQFILGGPREQLLEARRSLRRKRIPAVMLNMDLAFHNPAMRILRDLSYRRLNGLRVQIPHSPVLSCIDARLYPDERSAICRRITDLDENTVDWVRLIEEVSAHYPVKTFLELGPQETLCSISAELAPEINFIPADRKSREAQAMRTAFARLFACGALDLAKITACSEKNKNFKAGGHFAATISENACLHADSDIVSREKQDVILKLLAEVCGRDADAIRPNEDLRYDLGLRSINFPYLMLEAEQRLGHAISLDNLFQLNTVADLILFLTGAANSHTEKARGPRAAFAESRAPLSRYMPGAEELAAAPPVLDRMAVIPSRILGIIYDPSVGEDLFAGLVKSGAEVTLMYRGEENRLRSVWFSEEMRNRSGSNAGQNDYDLAVLVLDRKDSADVDRHKLASEFAQGQPLLVVRRFDLEKQREALSWLASQKEKWPDKTRAVAWMESDENLAQAGIAEASCLLVWEAAASEPLILWKRSAGGRHLLLGEHDLPLYLLDNSSSKSSSAPLEVMCQFSSYREPELALHGAGAAYTPCAQYAPEFSDASSLPLSSLYKVMLESAKLLEPGLMPIGFADWRIYRIPGLTPGITRECRLDVSNRISLYQEGVPATLCHISMAVAALAATGRKDGSWQSVGGMIMIMAASDPAIEPLWEGPVSLGAPWNSEECQCFYDMLGYGACWRFIQDMRKAIWSGGSHGISCILDFANFTSTAGQVLVIDAIFQAAMLALIIVKDCPFQSDLMKECLSAWRFASIGFARFKHVPFSRPGRLELCNSWLNEKLIRFDGQIRAPNGEIIFTLHNLEFERVSSTDKSDI